MRTSLHISCWVCCKIILNRGHHFAKLLASLLCYLFDSAVAKLLIFCVVLYFIMPSWMYLGHWVQTLEVLREIRPRSADWSDWSQHTACCQGMDLFHSSTLWMFQDCWLAMLMTVLFYWVCCFFYSTLISVWSLYWPVHFYHTHLKIIYYISHEA